MAWQQLTEAAQSPSFDVVLDTRSEPSSSSSSLPPPPTATASGENPSGSLGAKFERCESWIELLQEKPWKRACLDVESRSGEATGDSSLLAFVYLDEWALTSNSFPTCGV